jgi:hypothetical protein
VLNDAGQPVEYARNSVPGHSQFFTATLPAPALNQPHLELRWRYYFVGGSNVGSRARLRVDDIRVEGLSETCKPPGVTLAPQQYLPVMTK